MGFVAMLSRRVLGWHRRLFLGQYDTLEEEVSLRQTTALDRGSLNLQSMIDGLRRDRHLAKAGTLQTIY
jgi:hypothetical protein